MRCSLALDPGATGSHDYAERVLGSADFVESLRQDRLLDSPCSPQLGLSKLQEIIENYCQFPARGLAQHGRLNAVAEARALFCFVLCVGRVTLEQRSDTNMVLDHPQLPELYDAGK